jgi:hypothetical protein
MDLRDPNPPDTDVSSREVQSNANSFLVRESCLAGGQISCPTENVGTLRERRF